MSLATAFSPVVESVSYGARGFIGEAFNTPRAEQYLRAIFASSPVDSMEAQRMGFSTGNERTSAMSRRSLVTPVGYGDLQSLMRRVAFLQSRGYDCWLFLPSSMQGGRGFPLQSNFIRLFGQSYVRYVTNPSAALRDVANAPIRNPLGVSWINDRDRQPRIPQNKIERGVHPTNPVATGTPSSLEPRIEEMADEAVAKILEGEDPMAVYDAVVEAIEATAPKPPKPINPTQALVEYILTEEGLERSYQKQVVERINTFKAQGRFDATKAQGLANDLVKFAAKLYARNQLQESDWRSVFSDEQRKQVERQIISKAINE